MFSLTVAAVAALAALVPTASAQTHTNCNPLNTTTCPNMPALGANATFFFNETMNPDIWVQKNQGEVKWTNNGTALTVARRGDSPSLQSAFYLFFGRFEILLRAAPGQGIVSSAILQSEDLDEIDWEFLGGNTTHALTNYYGKGNTTMAVPSRGADFRMDSPPQNDFHNYTVDWTKERIQWYINGKMVRELKYGDALGGMNYPQTPMNIRLGVWAGGDTQNNNKGTVEWAGGETDFSKGPFTMMVQQIYAKDYTTAKEYSWEGMDASGSWEKVKIVEPNVKSSVTQEIEQPHGVDNRWKALSSTAKIGIIAGVAGFAAILACLILFCCIKQRRAGRREFAAYQAGVDKEAAELLQHKQEWASSHRGSMYRRI